MVATDRAEVRPLHESGAAIPPAMANIVMKLLRRDPAQRFQSAQELRDALQRFSQGAPTTDAGSLAVLTPEAGVRVEVRDGRNVVAEGPTPLRADGLPAGSYTVEVRDPRFELAESIVQLPGGATHDVTLSPRRKPPRTPERPKARRKGGRGRLLAALIVLIAVAGTAWAQPWGRTLDREALASYVASGAIDRVYLTADGLEGGLQIIPVDALEDFRMPFFVSLGESETPATVEELRDRGVEVDASWEVRRLMELAVGAQARSRYYGLDGGDVRSYALRLAELAPESPQASSLLFKVGERMAWDAEAALEEGSAEEARQLVDRCLDLVPDQPRCLLVSQSL
jgi:hypothetical protein